MNKGILTGLLFILLLLGCSDNINISGGDGVETGSEFSVSGTINRDSTTPAEETVVKLIPTGYNPYMDTITYDYITLTSSTGEYTFGNIKPGNYHIEAISLTDDKILISSEIYLDENTLNIPTETLVDPGSLILHLSDSTNTLGGIIHIKGTNIYSVIDSVDIAVGHVQINNVPTDVNYTIQFFDDDHLDSAIDVTDSINLNPDNSTIISPFHDWNYKYRVSLNTSTTGTELTEDLVHFPLLIRLKNSPNFNFSQAQTDGSDLRFTNSIGEPIDFEIELWDIMDNQAIIWVKIDTIYKDNIEQYIRMYTGKSGAENLSSPNKVFNTGDGYKAVWHMGANSDTLTLDATGKNNHGMINNATDAVGFIGRAKRFNGTNSYIKVANSSSLNFGTGDFSISVMVNRLSSDTTHQIFAKRDGGGGHFELQLQPDGTIRFYPIGIGRAEYLQSKDPIPNGGWTHITLRRSNDILTLFINGVQDNSMISSHNVNSTNDLYIGWDPHHEIEFFPGFIDELRLRRPALSDAWIKFSYDNLMDNNVINIVKE